MNQIELIARISPTLNPSQEDPRQMGEEVLKVWVYSVCVGNLPQ